MALHFATAWQTITDLIPDREALVCAEVRRTWREFDDRAARLAALLKNYGMDMGSKVGIYAHNSNEYLEAQYAIFKIRGCPINVNYRYTSDELVYVIENSDCEALFYQGCYAARIWEIQSRLSKVKLFVQIPDGTESLLPGSRDFEQEIRSNLPMPRIDDADPEDVYMLYTGGTTGMPKGVMYSHGSFINAMLGGIGSQGLDAPTETSQLPDLLAVLQLSGSTPTTLPACPLMHGTGMWLGAMIPLLYGGTVVTISKLGLDPHLIWDEVERNRVTQLVIVGDAFARPLLDALNHAADMGRPYDISSVKQIVSSGVMWSSEVKNGLLEHHNMVLVDAMGSTEGGMGTSVSSRDENPGTAKFTLRPGVKVFDDEDREVAPGSGVAGKLATSGLVPIGYYKDPGKSAATFREVDGVRYSFPGDFATVEEDGSITLLGRGSNCINTAGEKVYPEEVEEVIKQHPNVEDCLVVGLPDLRFGQRIVAVASCTEDSFSQPQEIIDFAREHLAGYKLPKQLFFEDTVRRSPAGKADYKWAKERATHHAEHTPQYSLRDSIAPAPTAATEQSNVEPYATRRRLVRELIAEHKNANNLARALSATADHLGYQRVFNAGQLSYLATRAKFRNIDPILMLCIESVTEGRISRRELVPEMFVELNTG